jgi:hypothetical protein
MFEPRDLLVLGALATLAPAQQVTMRATAVAPLVTSCATPTQSNTQTIPAGPLASHGFLAASLPQVVADATLGWATAIDNTSAGFSVQQTASVGRATPAAVSAAGPNDFRVEVGASATAAAFVRISLRLQATANAPMPDVQVDVGDDGSVEFTQANVSPWLVPGLVLGVTPVPIRIRVANRVSGEHTSVLQLTVAVEPANSLDIQRAVLGCAHPTCQDLLALPSFVGRGVELVAVTATALQPVVLVLGLSARPVWLSTFGAVPCLLLADPQLLVLVSTNQPSTLPLPTAVRPIEVWAQGVLLGPSGQLLSTDAVRVAGR